MKTMRHPLDPNHLDFGDDYEYRIYGNDAASIWVVVDAVDYHDACHIKWHANAPHPARKGNKIYFRTRRGWRNGASIYLHVWIMRRMGIIQPSPAHCLVDHIDGNEFNCRRDNLRWMTPQGNRHHAKANANTERARLVALFFDGAHDRRTLIGDDHRTGVFENAAVFGL